MMTRFLSLLVVGLVVGLVAVPAAGQDAAVEEAIAGLKKAQKEKIPADQIHYVQQLAEKWESADEKQRKSIHGLAKKGLRNRNKDVREATVVALARMKGGKKEKWGDSATKLLAGEIKQKHTEEDVTYFGKVLIAIGQVGHKKGVAHLTKLLNYKDYDVVASSAQALGEYKDSDIKVKKEIVKEVLKKYTSVFNQSRDPRNTTAQKRLQKVERPMEAALKALTGQQVTGANAWQT